MGGGGGGRQTTETKPWEGQQPYLEDLFANAQNMFDLGYGQQYYPGQTVAGFSPQTQMAMDMQTQRALSGSPQQAAMGDYTMRSMMTPNVDPRMMMSGAGQLMGGIQPGQNLLMQGGTPTDLGQAAQIAGLDGFAGGAGGVGESSQFGSYAPLATSMLDPYGQQQLRSTAMGGYLGSNPYLDAVYDTAAGQLTDRFTEDIIPGISSQFGAAGRTGSGAQALAYGRAAGDQADALAQLGADIYAPAYEAERGRQVQAAQALAPMGIEGFRTAADIYGRDLTADIARRQLAGDIYTGGLSRAIQAGGQLGDLGATGLGQLGDLYGTIGQDQYRAASLVPQLREMEYGDIGQLARVGGAIEDQTQRLIDAERERFMFGQQAPWQALAQYGNIVQGMPGGYGTTTSPGGGGGSRLMGGLGGAATGAGLASSLALSNPWTAGLAAGGALLGML